MTTVSVFTPSHDARWLNDCYFSLLSQTYTDWQWIVVLNDGARWQGAPPNDPRVQVTVLDQISGVGACKSYACQMAEGDILVELDHDDYLLPTALADIVTTLQARPEASLVYSHFSQTDDDLRWADPPFRFDHGWDYTTILTEVWGEERKLLQMHAMDASFPHNAGLIWYAPNHVRAFPRWAYEAAGGYDWHMDVLDDQDLMRRLYLVGDFVRIDKCLYLQRWHPSNTQRAAATNARIQMQTVEQYQEAIQAMALAWAARNGLMALDLGSAHNKPDGYLGVDQCDEPGVDLVGDIFTTLEKLRSNSVGVIRAVDFLEHISDRTRLFNEMHRVLAHGGMLLTLTPSTDGRGAFQDPTHISFYNENAFWYYTQYDQARFVPGITARFQVSYMDTKAITPWHEQHDILYVNANLVALKPGGARMGGICGWPESVTD